MMEVDDKMRQRQREITHTALDALNPSRKCQLPFFAIYLSNVFQVMIVLSPDCTTPRSPEAFFKRNIYLF